MEERKINFKQNDNSTLVVDENGKLAKKLKKIYNHTTLNLVFCCDQLQKGTLTEGMKETHLSVAEYHMIRFLKELNYDSILYKAKEERYKEIRSLNEENRELRRQLGEKASNEDAREKMKNISESIRAWWNIKGFGHTSSIKFGESGNIELVFSGMITSVYYQELEYSEKEKKEYLKNIGFDLDEDGFVLMSEKNTERLKTVITSKYPSAEIVEITLNFRSKRRNYRDIKVIVKNLDDISENL
ncbi:hypothetical protein PL373_05695 [Tenacibaculum maritimum]|nr:hypothetical protein [Tenacibaculum maritimum]MDB0600644.1 hypothetical protein [Tenacibaculum maritimum]MDB0612627.1 hypothetical protein [Tenacibaculum maritimum]